MRRMSLAAAALLCLMLSACGGGGGGGGGSGSGFNVRLGETSLTFDFVEGAQPAPQTISASWTGTPPDPVYLGAVVEGNAIDPSIPILLGASSANATVRPRAGLTTGDYTGRILFLVCTDSACNNRVGGSPLPIAYTVTVRPPLFTPVQAASFDYTVGSPIPPGRTVNVSVSNWTASASVPWLRLSANDGNAPGALTISLDPQHLSAGNFTGSVTVASGERSQVLQVTAVVRVPELLAGTGPVNFSAFTGQLPSPTQVTVSTQNSLASQWTATSNMPWLSLSATSGVTPATITVAAPGALQMARGRYTGDILFATTIEGVARTARVPVQMDLQRPELTLSRSSLSFGAINGAAIAPQSITVNSTAPSGVVTLAADVTVPWLELDRTTGTTAQAFAAEADPSVGPLASGSYAGAVQFTATAGVETWTLDVPVQLSLTRPTLSANPASIELGGDAGRSFEAAPLTLSLNTGSRAYGWTASQSGAGSWLQTATSGVASAMGTTIQLTPVRTGVQPGSHSKSVTFQAQVNGDVLTTTVPVSLNLDTHRLLALENGVAFTNTPQFSRLSRSIPVVSNFDVPIAWTATSDRPWLTVTPSGVAGGSIVLTANPATLATDSLEIATVTIVAGGADPAQSETIRVGLWNGSVTPTTRQTIAGVNFRHAFADPIRPYVYVNERDNTVRTFNVYTGLEVLPAIVLPTTTAWTMTANTDGSLLWVLSILDNRLIPIDLATRTVVSSQIITFDDHGRGQSTALTYARPNGVGMLFPGLGDAHAVTGEFLGPFALGPAAFSGDGKKAFAANTRWDVDYTSAHGGRYTREFNSGVPIAPAISEEVATNLDGSRVYFAAMNEYNVAVYNGISLAQLPRIEPRTARFNNLDVARDGRVAIGSEAFPPDTENLWLYRGDGTLITSYHNANGSNAFLGERIIVFSSDGNFILVPAGNLQIYPAPQ